jgi:hydroxymethylglutaryl-CoA lyase
MSGTVAPMLKVVMDVVPVERLAVHFHDTYGQALVNILVALQVGMQVCDGFVPLRKSTQELHS